MSVDKLIIPRRWRLGKTSTIKTIFMSPPGFYQ
nr:MAG TPA: hypothetical protein [Caudoviricetes sp.]